MKTIDELRKQRSDLKDKKENLDLEHVSTVKELEEKRATDRAELEKQDGELKAAIEKQSRAHIDELIDQYNDLENQQKVILNSLFDEISRRKLGNKKVAFSHGQWGGCWEMERRIAEHNVIDPTSNFIVSCDPGVE